MSRRSPEAMEGNEILTYRFGFSARSLRVRAIVRFQVLSHPRCTQTFFALRLWASNRPKAAIFGFNVRGLVGDWKRNGIGISSEIASM